MQEQGSGGLGAGPGRVAPRGELWKSTDGNSLEQPAQGLGLQDKGFGPSPGGRRSQRRLGERVDLMKKHLVH